MAQVIPLIVAWTQTSVVGWIFAATVKMAVAYAISRALSPKPGKLGSMSNPIQMTREPAAARRVVYGQTRVSGPVIFAHVTGAKNSDLHLVIALAGHKLAEIGQVLINDEIVEFGPDGETATGKYAGKLRVRKWLGDQTTADSVLVTESGGVWTSAHVCQGIACIYAKLVFDQDVFPQGIPNISAVVKGREVYDPRDESTAWSDNPALCALDYMRDTDVGFAADDEEIDYASHSAAASICDEAVTLAAGGTEKRYRCAGVFATDGEPAAIIEQLVGTMSGAMIYSGGKFSLKAGAYEIPTVEFDESHLRGPIQFQTDSSRRDVCNVVKGTYTSVADLYQPRDFPQWVDAAAVTADAEEITRDLALDWVHSPSQAQRIAAIEERASRLGGTIVLQCNLSGLRVQVGDSITVKNARFGWTAGEVFKVVQFKFSAGDGAVGVDLTCRRTAASVYAWTAASEGAVTPGAVPDGGDDIYTIPGEDPRIPGTIDELNGAGLGEPSGAIAVQSLGGVESLLGYGSYDGTDPLRRWRRRTFSGSMTCLSGVGSCAGLTATGSVAQSGSQYAEDNGSTTNTAVATPISGTGCGYSVATAISDAYGICGTSVGSGHCKTTTATKTTWVSVGGPSSGDCCTSDGTNYYNYSGTASVSLSAEDNFSAAIARLVAASDWDSGTNTAIQTIPTSGITILYRKARFGTYAGSPTLVYTPLTGLPPQERFAIRATLKRRPVDSSGSATGAYAAAGEVYSSPFIAALDGTGGAEWVEIEPIPGYEIAIDNLAVVSF